MKSPSQQPEWTCERFWELREAYLANRCEANALANLQKLAEIDPDLVPENAWIDCKDLLLLLLEDIPIAALLTSQQILFISALNNSPPHVVATLAGHFLKKRSETMTLLRSDAVAVAIAFARRIDDLNTCDVIADLLGPVLQNELIAKELMNQLDNSSNTEHRFRIYQVAISSLKSDKTTVVETTKTILTRAVNELEGDDVLQQLSVMDLFANVAIVSAVAAQFVGEVGLTQRVYDLMQKCKDEPDGGFLYPACIKFFGSLSYCYPEAITAYPAFLPAVIDQISMFDRLDASTRLLAFDTFAHIAHKQEAKTKIQGILGTEGLKRTLSHFGAACASGPVDLRTRHIDALAVMFEHGEETQLSNWFKELGDGFPHFSAVSVSKPFKDLKIALLRLFHAVLSREFGKQTYIPMAEFSEWLLNRKSEPDWECAQLKEDLIKRLIDSPSAFISPEFRQKLRDYFGPAEAQLNVAWIYDLLDTKPEGIMWRGRRQQNDQPDNWNGTWNRNQMSKQSNDRGNPFCSKSDDKQKSEEKLAEEYECCSDGEKGKRPIERWDVSRMHDVDAKQNQNRDFTRLIDDERSLTLNDPVTLGKFNPWLPAYANQLHPYLIIGKKREILNSERNCEAKWKYTGKLWPLEYNVDYEKLEHHRAQQKKVAPTDEEFKRFWKMNEERCKAELDLEIAVINSDRLIIRFLVKEIKNMNQYSQFPHGQLGVVPFSACNADPDTFRLLDALILAKIASSSSDSEDVYIHKKRLAKRICMELWFDLFEDLPTMAAFIYCVQKAAEDAIPEDIPYVDIAEFEATLHAVICREFPEDAKKCHHSPRDIWNVFGLTREDALKCGLLLACKIDASIWIRPHQLLFEQLVFTSSDRILEGCLYNLLSRFSDDYAVDFEQIKQKIYSSAPSSFCALPNWSNYTNRDKDELINSLTQNDEPHQLFCVIDNVLMLNRNIYYWPLVL